MDEATYKKTFEKTMETVLQNIGMMNPNQSVFEYDPYTRYYLNNQDEETKTKENSDIVQRIINVKKRAKK